MFMNLLVKLIQRKQTSLSTRSEYSRRHEIRPRDERGHRVEDLLGDVHVDGGAVVVIHQTVWVVVQGLEFAHQEAAGGVDVLDRNIRIFKTRRFFIFLSFNCPFQCHRVFI